MERASSSSRCPAGVSFTGMVLRSKSGSPQSSSITRTWCDTAGWLRCRRSAALDRLWVSTMAEMVRR